MEEIRNMLRRWRESPEDDDGDFISPKLSAIDKAELLLAGFHGPPRMIPNGDGGICFFLSDEKATLEVLDDASIVLFGFDGSRLAFFFEGDLRPQEK